jgi:uncharacterized membrane protein (UPF0127 family)
MPRSKVLVFFVIVMLVAMLGGSMMTCANDLKSTFSGSSAVNPVSVAPSVGSSAEQPAAPTPVEVPNDPNSKHPEVPFVSEGELSFVDKNGKTLQKIEIEIADDDRQREQGLMWRKKMLDSRGMVFIFSEESPQRFWMRNTYLPLDIIYVNSKMEIVSIQKNCAILNDKGLPSAKPAQFVVEVNGGFSDKHGIKEGTKIMFKDLINNKSY